MPACVIRVCYAVVYRVWRFRRFLIWRNLHAVNSPSIFQWISGETSATCRFSDFIRLGGLIGMCLVRALLPTTDSAP